MNYELGRKTELVICKFRKDRTKHKMALST